MLDELYMLSAVAADANMQFFQLEMISCNETYYFTSNGWAILLCYWNIVTHIQNQDLATLREKVNK